MQVIFKSLIAEGLVCLKLNELIFISKKKENNDKIKLIWNTTSLTNTGLINN